MEKPEGSLLAINLNKLEENCQSQPALTREWGFKLAAARKGSKVAKNTVKVMGAELEKRIRSNPGDYGMERATDKAVEAIVLTDEAYQNAIKDQIQAEYEQDILEAFMESIRDRRTQLGNEVQLHGQMYFSKVQEGPSMNSRQREAVQSEISGGKKKKKRASLDD